MKGRRERVVSDLYSAWCCDCNAHYPHVEGSGTNPRMWAIRHGERTGHTVDVQRVVVRRYMPKDKEVSTQSHEMALEEARAIGYSDTSEEDYDSMNPLADGRGM